MPPPPDSFLPSRTRAAKLVRVRLEVIITLLLDTAVVVVALLARWFLLKVYAFATQGHPASWHLSALELVLNYGIVAAALALTTFDLAKRVREGYRQLKKEDPDE